MPRITGRLEKSSVAGEVVEAFLPFPLPPENPPIELNENLIAKHNQARSQLQRLELAGEIVPSLNWFVYAFVRKEAVVSSQIEGTQSTLVDLLEHEIEQRSNTDPDLQEVCNYLEALDFARAQLSSPTGFPISRRLLDQAHRLLMLGVGGADKQTGQIRRSQNWIGGTRATNAEFVPPPPHLLPELLSQFETYIHSDDSLPPLVRVGLIHAQFETIHPYLDGNGRIGRLLITLLLEQWRLLSSPLLYLSLFLKRHRQEYYRLLTAVRQEGDWESWIAFFLEGVSTIAREAADKARDLFAMVNRDRTALLAHPQTSLNAQRLFEELPENPLMTTSRAMSLLKTSRPTALKTLSIMVAAGILEETSGTKRKRRYAYTHYLSRLREGTDLDG